MGEQMSLAEALLHPKLGVNTKLAGIHGQVDWTPIGQLAAKVRAPAATGRKPYRPLPMLKIIYLQAAYNLGDKEMEEEPTASRSAASAASAWRKARRTRPPSGASARRRRWRASWRRPLPRSAGGWRRRGSFSRRARCRTPRWLRPLSPLLYRNGQVDGTEDWRAGGNDAFAWCRRTQDGKAMIMPLSTLREGAIRCQYDVF